MIRPALLSTTLLIFALVAAAPVAAQSVAPWVQSLCEEQNKNLIGRRDCLKREQAALPVIASIEEIYGQDGRDLLKTCTPEGAPSFAATASCATAQLEAAEGVADSPLADPAKLRAFRDATGQPAEAATSAFGRKANQPVFQGANQ